MLALERIRRLRGLSQRELAEKAGVSPATVYELETGRRPQPRGSTLRKLAGALDVEIVDFFEEADSPKASALPRESAGGAFRERPPFNARTASLYMGRPQGNTREEVAADLLDWIGMQFLTDEKFQQHISALQQLLEERRTK